MRKLFGAAAILLGCFWAAWSRIRDGHRRESALLSVRDGLTEWRRQLAERRGGMRDIVRELADKNEQKPIGKFYTRLFADMDELGEKSFSEIWRLAVRDELGMLGETAFDTLGALGENLGGCELALQCQALERASLEMERLAREEKAALPVKRRMSFGFSMAVGTLLVIMLI